MVVVARDSVELNHSGGPQLAALYAADDLMF
jgi:hypothetical protein